jgi:hypothetical protein
MAVATCVTLDLGALNLDEPALFEDVEEEEEAAVPQSSPVPSSSASTSSTKRGKANRRQRRRREGAEPAAQDTSECCSLPCDNGNERLFTALDSAFLREQATFAQRAETMSESCAAVEPRAANNAETDSMAAECTVRKVRRKRTGGKRKKQPTPECQEGAAKEEVKVKATVRKSNT